MGRVIGGDAERGEGPASRARRERPRRVFYAAGPGDVVGTFRHWKEGQDDPGQMAMTWSGQFFDVCREQGFDAEVMSWHKRPDRERDGRFVVSNCPKPAWTSRGGWRYHLGQQWFVLRLLVRVLRSRADIVLLGGGNQLWPFALLRLLGVKVVVDFTCVLWPQFRPRRGVTDLLLRLDRAFLRRHALALLSASCDITRQLSEVAGGRPRPVIEYLPTYRRDRFVRLPVPAGSPFRIVFAGRIEVTKGVLTLLELARRFRDGGRAIAIDVCGDGGALEEMRRRVEEERLSSHIALHGYCLAEKLGPMYARSHAVIVPTTSAFIEGFNMVVVEAVLSGRPVVTSPVCPSVHYLGEAVVVVPVDDVSAYQRAIERLADDPAHYERVLEAGKAVGEKFFDPELGFASALRAAFGAACAASAPPERTLALAERAAP